MSEDEFKRRMERVDSSIAELAIQVARLVASLDHIKEQSHELRIRELERVTENNRLAVAAMKWLTAAVVASALSVAGALILEVMR